VAQRAADAAEVARLDPKPPTYERCFSRRTDEQGSNKVEPYQGQLSEPIRNRSCERGEWSANAKLSVRTIAEAE
jgi:hypothetical protein